MVRAHQGGFLLPGAKLCSEMLGACHSSGPQRPHKDEDLAFWLQGPKQRNPRNPVLQDPHVFWRTFGGIT